jgi:hypothetical protein
LLFYRQTCATKTEQALPRLRKRSLSLVMLLSECLSCSWRISQAVRFSAKSRRTTAPLPVPATGGIGRDPQLR